MKQTSQKHRAFAVGALRILDDDLLKCVLGLFFRLIKWCSTKFIFGLAFIRVHKIFRRRHFRPANQHSHFVAKPAQIQSALRGRICAATTNSSYLDNVSLRYMPRHNKFRAGQCICPRHVQYMERRACRDQRRMQDISAPSLNFTIRYASLTTIWLTSCADKISSRIFLPRNRAACEVVAGYARWKPR